ncbi:MAG: phosphoribosyltransferase family protein [Nitrososphaeraceae archaeon]|nr:phosphoribosyltransferase family protein [Nitrososphaeraceae archaeon]
MRDRTTAANILGVALKNIIKKEEERKNSIVLGIPRGGTIIADIIARKLSCEFDIIIPRKLRSPHNEEVAIGAIMGDGTNYLNEVLVRELDASPEYIEEKTRQMEDIRGRVTLYHGDTVSKDYDINNNKTVGYFWLNKFTDTMMLRQAPYQCCFSTVV